MQVDIHPYPNKTINYLEFFKMEAVYCLASIIRDGLVAGSFLPTLYYCTGLPSDVYFFTFLSCFADDENSFSCFVLALLLKYDTNPHIANGTPIPNAGYAPCSNDKLTSSIDAYRI